MGNVRPFRLHAEGRDLAVLPGGLGADRLYSGCADRQLGRRRAAAAALNRRRANVSRCPVSCSDSRMARRHACISLLPRDAKK